MCNYPAGDSISSNLFAPQHRQEWVIMMTFFENSWLFSNKVQWRARLSRGAEKLRQNMYWEKSYMESMKDIFLISNYITREKLVGWLKLSKTYFRFEIYKIINS